MLTQILFKPLSTCTVLSKPLYFRKPQPLNLRLSKAIIDQVLICITKVLGRGSQVWLGITLSGFRITCGCFVGTNIIISINFTVVYLWHNTRPISSPLFLLMFTLWYFKMSLSGSLSTLSNTKGKLQFLFQMKLWANHQS